MTDRHAGGIGWTIAAQICSVSVSLTATFILSRLLRPDDFGLVAAVAPVVGFAQQLQSLGFSSAIVHSRKIGAGQLSTLFWGSLFLSVALVILIIFASPLLARLMGDARLENIYAVGALSIVLTSLSAQPQALLARDLRFRAIAVRTIATTLFATAVTIMLAVAWQNYWALVANMLVTPLVMLVLCCSALRWRPGWPILGSGLRPLLTFSSKVWTFNQFTFVARNADSLVVASATSAHELGLYNRAYSILLFPISRAILPFGQFAVPSLSRERGDPPRYSELYWRLTMLTLLACQPLFLTALIFPEAVVQLLLGDQWEASAPVLAWFAAGGLFEVFAMTIPWALISQGRGHDLVRVGLVNSATAIASFLMGVRWGITGVAVCYVIGQALCALPHAIWVAGRTGPLDWRSMRVGLLPSGLALCASGGALEVIRRTLGSDDALVVPAALSVAYLVYAAALVSQPSARALLIRGSTTIRASSS